MPVNKITVGHYNGNSLTFNMMDTVSADYFGITFGEVKVGQLLLGNDSDLKYVNYSNYSLDPSSYFSNYEEADFEINVLAYDSVNSTLNGTFSGVLVSPTTKDSVSFENGVFDFVYEEDSTYQSVYE